jgi:purine-nucleoside phosphorylase
MFDRVEAAAAAVRVRCGALPATAIVLGSGLGDFAGTLTDASSMPYAELPHWPVSRVVGHEGRLVVGQVGRVRVAALSGRVHFYEGHDLATVVFATRVMGRLGVRHQHQFCGRSADGDRRSHQPVGEQPARGRQ